MCSSTIGKHLASSRSLESLDRVGGLLATFINRSRAKRESDIEDVLYELEPAWGKHALKDKKAHVSFVPLDKKQVLQS